MTASRETTEPTKPTPMTLDPIRDMICASHDCTLLALRSRRRDRAIVKAREDFSKFAFQMGFGYSEIGRYLNKDHSSIMNLVRRPNGG